MHLRFWRTMVWTVLALSPFACAQQAASCGDLMQFKAPGVEISKAAPIAAGTTEPNPWGPGHSAPLPAYCRVEGVINRRTGVGGEEFGIKLCSRHAREMEWRFPDAGRRRRERIGTAPTRSECCGRHSGTHARIRCGQYGHGA